jgi:enoyl-CoA hydratase/carnithine racemase
MNRPHNLNALNSDLMSEMLTAFKELEVMKNRSDRTYGAGKSFCTGHDLKELTTLSPLDRRESLGDPLKFGRHFI